MVLVRVVKLLNANFGTWHVKKVNDKPCYSLTRGVDQLYIFLVGIYEEWCVWQGVCVVRNKKIENS